MPIHVDVDVTPISEDGFREIAYVVTGAAFAVPNEYGSLFSEKVYKYEIAAECRRRGVEDIQVEAPIKVTYADFSKEYFADLLINRGALFELKVATGLIDEHRAQTLNYLFLMELHRAKLFNFGTRSLQHEFINTTLTRADRMDFTVERQSWADFDHRGARFRELTIELLNDWGSFLQLPLYYDALTYFFGGEDEVIREISVLRDGREVMKQKVHLLSPEMAFKVTAITDHLDTIREHMRRFLRHTELRAIQWVNLHHHTVEFKTLLNE
jgi:GxxExxY protein